VSSSQTFAGNTTLYAKWKIATYNITYELNGGTNHASNPATYTVESLPLTLQNPTLSGFTFAGVVYGGWVRYEGDVDSCWVDGCEDVLCEVDVSGYLQCE
jgi:hypothetical protein